MRLSDRCLERVSELVVRGLIEEKLIKLKSQRESVKRRIKKVFTDEMKIEEDLDREAAALLKKNMGSTGGETIDYDHMLKMVRTKLAKQKGIVL